MSEISERGDASHGADRENDSDFPLSMTEFVAMMAVLMACTALTIDIMLGALPSIAGEFALEDQNQQQFMITSYMLCFSIGQLFAGPLADRFGRRPVILFGLFIYTIGGFAAAFADSYAMLLLARSIQGLGAAGPRVVAVAVVRDRYVGRTMSQVMSFIMTVFIMLPVIAPTIGSVIDGLGGWRSIFLCLAVFGAVVALWVFARLPETDPRRRGLAPIPLTAAMLTIFRNRETIGYMFALGFVFGCLLAFVSSAQQLFEHVYGVVFWFPAIFASVAGAMVVSTLVNAKLVMRFGMRGLSHTASVALFVLAALATLAMLAIGTLELWMMLSFQCLAFFFIGLMLPNFNAMAMEPLGRIAGTGSAFIGFVMTGLGTILGGTVGLFFDKSHTPLLFGYLIYSAVILVIIAITERGILFRRATPRDTGAPAAVAPAAEK